MLPNVSMKNNKFSSLSQTKPSAEQEMMVFSRDEITILNEEKSTKSHNFRVKRNETEVNPSEKIGSPIALGKRIRQSFLS